MWGKPGVAMADQRTEIPRDEVDIPTRWYSAVPNPPQPVTPDLHTGTWQPIGPDDLDLALVPPPVDADEPGYHGGVPVHCKLNNDLSLPPLPEPHSRILKTAVPVGRTEGIISAPESARATLSVINRAFVAREAGERRVIAFNLCGHGHFDMAAYDAYFAGQLEDVEYPAEAIDAALADLPKVGAD